MVSWKECGNTVLIATLEGIKIEGEYAINTSAQHGRKELLRDKKN